MLDLTNPYRDDAWPTVEVDEQSPHDSPDEPMGSKTKFWVRVNSKGETRPWLFKFARVKDGEVRGEDWAEVLVHRVAGLIDIPTALVVPATYRGRRGVLSRHMLGRLAEELVHGNELLAAFHPDYEPWSNERMRGTRLRRSKRPLLDSASRIQRACWRRPRPTALMRSPGT